MSSEPPTSSPLPSPERCDHCGTIIPQTGNYCPTCGAVKPSMRYSGLPVAGDRRWGTGPQYYAPVRKIDWRKGIKAIGAYAILGFVVQLALMLITLVYGAGEVVPDIQHTWHKGLTLFLVLPVLIKIVAINGNVLLVYYFALIAAIIASSMWVLMTSYRGFIKELTMKATSREHSALYDTGALLFATLFFSVVAALISNPAPSDLPEEGTLSENLLLLANASVWEELAVRVLLIGVPLGLYGLLMGKTGYRFHKYFLGGGFKIGAPEVVLILASAVMFGIAHYTGGWGIWKIVPASVGGIAFGYLFLKHGLAASILMHFGTDYLSMPATVFDSTVLTVLLGLGILVWLAFGFVYFTYYSTRTIEFLTGDRIWEPTQPVPVAWTDPRMQMPVYESQYYPPPQAPGTAQAPQPPPVQYSFQPSQGFGGGYVCPACGFTQARWVDGKFQCLRCGRVS